MMKALSSGLLVCALCACRADGSHEHEATEDNEFQGCPQELPAFALGMETAGERGRIRARLIAASQEPPLRYLNDWTIALLDEQGAPLADARVTQARPFMPIHGHDGNRDPRIVPVPSEPGTVEIRALNFIMRGPWEVQLTVSSPTAGDDYLVFQVCVQE